MKKLKETSVSAVLLTASLFLSTPIYANRLDSLVGSFFSEGHDAVTLVLTADGKYEAELTNEMTEMKTEGTWIQKTGKIFLTPKKSTGFSFVDNTAMEDTWTSKLVEVSVLSKNKLFIRDGDEHIHLKRVNKWDHDIFEVDFEANKYDLSLNKLSEIAAKLKEMESSGNLRISLFDFSTDSELLADKYIGVKRCKEIIDYLRKNSRIRENAFIIYPWKFWQTSHLSYIHIEVVTYDYVRGIY
jgi:hypothetical protein